MDNPFSIIDKRLEDIERCLREIMSLTLSSTQEPHNGSSDKEVVMDIDQLAEYLRCVKSTVLRYKRDGVIPFYQAGRSAYFKKDEVDKALSSWRRNR